MKAQTFPHFELDLLLTMAINRTSIPAKRRLFYAMLRQIARTLGQAKLLEKNVPKPYLHREEYIDIDYDATQRATTIDR